VLQAETWSLSGGVHHWLKSRSTREERKPVTRNDDDNNNNQLNGLSHMLKLNFSWRICCIMLCKPNDFQDMSTDFDPQVSPTQCFQIFCKLTMGTSSSYGRTMWSPGGIWFYKILEAINTDTERPWQNALACTELVCLSVSENVGSTRLLL
jgi:hypothetical protein